MTESEKATAPAAQTKSVKNVKASERGLDSVAAGIDDLLEAVGGRLAGVEEILDEEKEFLAGVLRKAPDGSPRHAPADGELHFQHLLLARKHLLAVQGGLASARQNLDQHRDRMEVAHEAKADHAEALKAEQAKKKEDA